MNTIKRKKNGGDIIIEPLVNGFEGLVDGDEYVYVGKHNTILLYTSEKTIDTNIAKVIWDYNVKDRDRVINKFYGELFQKYKEYILEYNMVNDLDLKDHEHYEVFTECDPATIKEFFQEELEIHQYIKEENI